MTGKQIDLYVFIVCHGKRGDLHRKAWALQFIASPALVDPRGFLSAYLAYLLQYVSPWSLMGARTLAAGCGATA